MKKQGFYMVSLQMKSPFSYGSRPEPWTMISRIGPALEMSLTVNAAGRPWLFKACAVPPTALGAAPERPAWPEKTIPRFFQPLDPSPK